VLYQFISVQRAAQNPIGYAGDQSQVAAYVLRGTGYGGTLFTLLAYENVPDANAFLPMYTAHLGIGNGVRLFWQQNGIVYLTDFVHAQSASVGTNVSNVASLALTGPDFLYSGDEKKLYFVQGWNRSTFAITLNLNDTKFPVKESRLAAIGTLAALPKTLSPTSKSIHTINDTSLVPKL
jgi:hypothetical protein